MFRRRATQRHQGRDEVHVQVASGYRPAVATVHAGVPIRIVFHRHDDDPCTDRVIFSTPRVERRLAADGTTSVDLPARPAGEIRYTCGMGRYSGMIRVAEPADDWLHRLRGERRTMSNAATVAFIVVAVGLPIVATLALLFLDDVAAATISVAAVVAAIAALMWMYGIPTARRDLSRSSNSAKSRALRGAPEPDQVTPTRRLR